MRFRVCDTTSYDVQGQFLSDVRTSWVHGVGTGQQGCGAVGLWWGGDTEPSGLTALTPLYSHGKIYRPQSTYKNLWTSLDINFTSTIKEKNSNGRTEGKSLSQMRTNQEAGDLIPALWKSLKRGKKATELYSQMGHAADF